MNQKWYKALLISFAIIASAFIIRVAIMDFENIVKYPPPTNHSLNCNNSGGNVQYIGDKPTHVWTGKMYMTYHHYMYNCIINGVITDEWEGPYPG